MAEHAGKPKVRFAGFTEDWEQRKLGEIADKVTEKNTTLRYTEALTNSAEFGIIGQRDFFDHNVAKLSSLHGYYIVKQDDFVYNPRISVTAPVGPVNRNKLGKIGVVSPLYTVLRTAKIDNEFLEWFFKSACWHSFMIFNGDSGARSDRFSIKNSTFFEMPIPCPCRMEQVRIGTFFRHLDRLVTLHQRKRGRLENIKKAMLEKMFPKNGADVPEVRFAGFTEAWEQREFKNLFKILPNNTLSRAELSFEKGIIKNIHYGDILIRFTEMLDSCDKKIPFINRDINFKIKDAILKNGDIVIADAAEDAAVGKCTELFNVSQNEQIVSGLHTIPCRPNIQFARGFLGYYMNSNSYHMQLTPLMQGIKVLSLSKSSLQDTLIAFPRKKEEQARIGTFFRHLDRLITLHQRKVALLQNIRKACLEKMFV